jgi:chromosome segregation ATPase
VREQLKKSLMDHITSQFETHDATLKKSEARHQTYMKENEARWIEIEAQNAERYRISEQSREELQAKVSMLENTTQAMSKGALALENKMNESKDNTDDNFEENDKFVTDLAEEIAKLRDEVDSLRQRPLAETLTDSTNLATTPERLAILQSRIETLEEAHPDRSSSAVIVIPQQPPEIPDLTALYNGIKALQTQISTLNSTIPLYATRITTLETSLANLQPEFQTHKHYIATLGEEMKDMRATYKEVEEQVTMADEILETVIPLIIGELRGVRDGINDLAKALDGEEEEDDEDEGDGVRLEAEKYMEGEVEEGVEGDEERGRETRVRNRRRWKR